MMRTVAVLSQKGGAGKTTLAINIAVAAERANPGRSVLIDLDPQASASIWGDSREQSAPRVVSVQASRLVKALEDERRDGTLFAVIDTAPHAEAAALSAARVANLILIPCRPGILDLHAIGATIDLARLAETPAAVVLNAVPPRGGLADEATEAVAAYGVPLAPCRITQRAAFVHSLTAGKAIEEFEPQNKGSDEIRELYRWIESFPDAK